jgi:hypothetical protein
MHKVLTDGSAAVEMMFLVATAEDDVSVSIGKARRSEEEALPTLPTLIGEARTEVWMMDVDGTSVALVIISTGETAAASVTEARDVIRSIRVTPSGNDSGFRLVFQLPEGWDSG